MLDQVPCQAKKGYYLIERAVGFTTGMRLGNPASEEEAGLTLIALIESFQKAPLMHEFPKILANTLVFVTKLLPNSGLNRACSKYYLNNPITILLYNKNIQSIVLINTAEG